MFQKIAEPEPKEEPVAIRKFPPRPSTRPTSLQKEPTRIGFDSEKPRTNMVANALLIALAVLVVTVGVVGSGFVNVYVQNNPIAQFLGGTSTIVK